MPRRRACEEAELLTQLLCSLASKRNPAPHFFVILTMRSDYLGECARFEGFAETVNSCQYLLPRLDDFGLLRAIHEPASSTAVRSIRRSATACSSLLGRKRTPCLCSSTP